MDYSKEQLTLLTKERLIEIGAEFGLDLKMAEAKYLMIEKIQAAITPTPEPEPEPEPKLIVVHPIAEDGVEFERGSEYTGRFAERFLKDGQIERR